MKTKIILNKKQSKISYFLTEIAFFLQKKAEKNFFSKAFLPKSLLSVPIKLNYFF